MKKFIIKFYILLHRILNPVIVFFMSYYCCLIKGCSLYKAMITNKTKKIKFQSIMAPTTFDFVKFILADYKSFTENFFWTSDYLGGAIDIHPNALLFLCRNKKDDCDGSATAYLDLLKKAETQSYKKITVSKVILYKKDTSIFSLNFWQTLHIVLLIKHKEGSFVLSNGNVCTETEYFSNHYTNAGHVVYTSIKI